VHPRGRTLKLEHWFDFACPFSYLGRARLERALATLEPMGRPLLISRSWQNDPAAPRDYGATMAEVASARYGMTLEQARAANSALTAEAAADGLDYDIDHARPGNTLDAHRLFHFARTRNLGPAYEERMLRAFICDGEPIGDPETLTRITVEVGMDHAEVRAVLDGDAHAHDVRTDRARGLANGVAGVPFLLVDNEHHLPGVHRVEDLVGFLERCRTSSGDGDHADV
jgi:predicted DsbA family dithiol-disulfide isomerase